MMKNEKTSMIGKMMILEGLILVVPVLIIPFYFQERKLIWMFLLPAFVSIALGYLVCKCKRNPKKLNSNRFVVGAWMYGFILGAIPFYLYGNLNFVQATFESVSGFTTTGLSVLNVVKTPQIFLFYRSFLQYVGGLGFVMMMLVFIQSKHSVTLYEAEGHPDRLMPNIGKTAKVILEMYSFFLVIGSIAYVIAGMNIFDSVIHTMCALSTGGFSNRLTSIGYYNSVPIEVITVILMIIGTTNFSLLLLLFRGKLKEFTRSSEMRFLVGLVGIFVPIIALFLASSGSGVLYSIRQAFFNAFSALSTTGYATSDYNTWPQVGIVLLILLMIIGGGIGSTAGGIKLGRICIVLKNLWRNIKLKVLPDRSVLLCHYNRGVENEVLSDDRVEEASTYAQTYLIIYVIGTILLSYFAGCSILKGAFEFASSLGTVGLSIGVTSIHTSSICLIIEIIGMILGRLEIFAIFKVFARRSS
ncbi:MAG: potassium transporter TrkG [Thomasclavelia sp.]|jgi:trk system potassium uptake protein TrkH|nr:potassium transporter TrkG [Thomasclavelia sp.]